jgi:hypothetical protein
MVKFRKKVYLLYLPLYISFKKNKTKSTKAKPKWFFIIIKKIFFTKKNFQKKNKNLDIFFSLLLLQIFFLLFFSHISISKNKIKFIEKNFFVVSFNYFNFFFI